MSTVRYAGRAFIIHSIICIWKGSSENRVLKAFEQAKHSEGTFGDKVRNARERILKG